MSAVQQIVFASGVARTADTFDPSNKSALASLSGGNLIATYNNDGFDSSAVVNTIQYFASSGATSGKWYAEIVSTWVGGSLNTEIGITQLGQGYNTNNTLSGLIANNNDGYAYTQDKIRRDNSTLQSGLAQWVSGDYVGIAFDSVNGTLDFYLNGAAVGVQVAGIDVTNPWTFAVNVGQGSAATVMTANFGATAFAYAPPAGYSGWG